MRRVFKRLKPGLFLTFSGLPTTGSTSPLRTEEADGTKVSAGSSRRRLDSGWRRLISAPRGDLALCSDARARQNTLTCPVERR